MTAHKPLWLPPPSDLTLAADDVHVFKADLDISYWQQLSPTLSSDEQSRAKRFYFPQHRQRFIAARGILRLILGRYLNIEPQDVEFCYQTRGKPVLAHNCSSNGLAFNVSHSESVALYAVTRVGNIGVDLEYLRPMPNLEQLAKRFFTAKEYATICNIPPQQQQEVFFRYWTCKEAYLKATGEGLSGLDEVEISLTPTQPAQLQSCQGWKLLELQPATNYVGAVAATGTNWHLHCWQF